jgi:methyl-accepting chemotaxis protein
VRLRLLLSSASAERTTATRTVADAMQTIANIAGQSAAGSRETSKAVRHLVALSERFNAAIGRFRIAADEPVGGEPADDA